MSKSNEDNNLAFVKLEFGNNLLQNTDLKYNNSLLDLEETRKGLDLLEREAFLNEDVQEMRLKQGQIKEKIEREFKIDPERADPKEIKAALSRVNMQIQEADKKIKNYDPILNADLGVDGEKSQNPHKEKYQLLQIKQPLLEASLPQKSPAATLTRLNNFASFVPQEHMKTGENKAPRAYNEIVNAAAIIMDKNPKYAPLIDNMVEEIKSKNPSLKPEEQAQKIIQEFPELIEKQGVAFARDFKEAMCAVRITDNIINNNLNVGQIPNKNSTIYAKDYYYSDQWDENSSKKWVSERTFSGLEGATLKGPKLEQIITDKNHNKADKYAAVLSNVYDSVQGTIAPRDDKHVGKVTHRAAVTAAKSEIEVDQKSIDKLNIIEDKTKFVFGAVADNNKKNAIDAAVTVEFGKLKKELAKNQPKDKEQSREGFWKTVGSAIKAAWDNTIGAIYRKIRPQKTKGTKTEKAENPKVKLGEKEKRLEKELQKISNNVKKSVIQNKKHAATPHKKTGPGGHGIG